LLPRTEDFGSHWRARARRSPKFGPARRYARDEGEHMLDDDNSINQHENAPDESDAGRENSEHVDVATGSTAATHRAAGRPAGPPAAVGTDLFSPPTGPAESGNGDGPLTSLPPAGQASSRGRAATTEASVADPPTASPADSTDGSSTGSTTGSTIGEVSAPSTAESTPEGPPHGTAPEQSTSNDTTSNDTVSNDGATGDGATGDRATGDRATGDRASSDRPSSDSASSHAGGGHGKSATREAAAPAATGLTFQAPTTTLLPPRSAKTGSNGGTDDS